LDHGERVITVELDVSDLSAVERAADQTESAFGNVHVVCNNAGIGSNSPLGFAMSKTDWEKVIDVNLHGVFNGVHVFIPRLLQHGEGGHVVNTASTAGLQPNKGQLAYCASKYAVVGLSEVLRKDLADENVSVSVLCPWVVDTAMHHRDLDDDDVKAIADRRESLTWLKDLAVSADLVGEQVADAIIQDEMFIFCDGGQTREMLDKRTKDLFDVLDRQFPKQA